MKTSVNVTELVSRFRQGDENAFTQIYEETYKYLYTCAINVVKNEEVANDMLQEAYLEIYKHIDQLQRDSDFLSWASTITNRKCFRYIKKQKDILVDNAVDELDYFESIADDESFIPENIFDDKAQIQIIKDIIDELSDVQRACIIGYFYNEQKQDEIAEQLGLPLNTVKSHLSRAKAKIKEAVGDVEKKQGIKLYSVAPFMLLFFVREAEAYGSEIAVPAMGSELQAVMVKKPTNAVKAGMMAGKTKAVIGIVAATLAIGTGAAVYMSTRAQDGPKQTAEYQQQEAETEADAAMSQNSEEEINGDSSAAEGAEAMSTDGNIQSVDVWGNKLDLANAAYIVSAKNGVAVVMGKDDYKYFMMDYEGNVISEAYDSYAIDLTDDGIACFTNFDENFMAKSYVVDSTGKVIFESKDNEIVTSIDDEFILCKGSLYRISDGSLFYEAKEFFAMWEENDYIQEPAITSFSGDFAYTHIDRYVYSIDRQGNTKKILKDRGRDAVPSDDSASDGVYANGIGGDSWEDPMRPEGAEKNGYFYCDDTNNKNEGYLISADGEIELHFDLSDYGEEIAAKLGCSEAGYYGVNGFTINGTSYTNYGPYVFFVAWDESDSSRFENFMLNVETGQLSDAYAFIDVSDEKYWAFGVEYEEERLSYGYMDHDGNIVKTYDEATAFVNGTAVVIENEEAFIINDNFEKVSEAMHCSKSELGEESVRHNYSQLNNAGDIIGITTGPETVEYYLIKK